MAGYRWLVAVYFTGVAGALTEIWGGYWDVSWHLLGLVETFFTLPHIILYTGLGVQALAVLLGLVLRLASRGEAEGQKRLLRGANFAFFGVALQFVAGPLDFWWHEQYGFDPFLFTPSHSLLIIGIAISGFGMASGFIRLLYAATFDSSRRSLAAPWKLTQLFALAAFAVLWLDLNSLIYLVTDASGLAYTFRLGREFAQSFSAIFDNLAVVLLGVAGTLIVGSAKKVLGWRGAATAVAVLSAMVSLTANLGFRALILGGSRQGGMIVAFIPLYLAFLIPVLVFDLKVDLAGKRLKVLVVSALIGPFVSFLDGFNSLPLWATDIGIIPLLLPVLLLSGLLGTLIKDRFTGKFLRHESSVMSSWKA